VVDIISILLREEEKKSMRGTEAAPEKDLGDHCDDFGGGVRA